MSKKYTEIKEMDGTLGEWSVPGINKEIQGVLALENEALTMVTVESFEDDFLDPKQYPVINGYLADGNEVTLLECLSPSITMHCPGFQKEVYSPTYIIIGRQYESEDIRVKKISATFNDISRWIGERCFFKDSSDKNEIKVLYKKPIFEIVPCGNKKIYFESEYSTKINIFSSSLIEQNIWLTMEFDEAIKWKDAYSSIYDFSEFLTLCMGTKCIPYYFKAQDSEGNNINIIENSEQDIIPKTKRRFLIDYSDIKGDYAAIVNNWFVKQNEISPVIHYFVDAHSVNKKVYVIPGFLRMAQALESFSRKLRQTTLLPPEEHEKRIERVLNHFDDGDDKKWLEEVLSTPVINEPSCQQRITALFKELPAELSLSNTKLRSLSYKIVMTRNYYTHFNESLKSEILRTRELYYSTVFMKYVIRILLANEIGIDQMGLIEHIREDSEFGIAIRELKLRK